MRDLSLAATFDHILELFADLQRCNPLRAVSVVLSNELSVQSLQRHLLGSGKALANVRVETLRRHVLRLVEPVLLAARQHPLDRDTAEVLMERALANCPLSWLAPAREYASYSTMLVALLEELDTNLEDKVVRASLATFGARGIDLLAVRAAFHAELAHNPALQDWPNIVQRYDRGEEFLLIFEDVVEGLSKLAHDRLLRGAWKVVTWREPKYAPQGRVRNPLSARHEVREALREVLISRLPLDRCALVVPADYLALVEDEADQAGLPVFLHEGVEPALLGLAMFRSLLFLALEGYSHVHFAEYLRSRGSWGMLRELIEFGIAEDFPRLLLRCAEELGRREQAGQTPHSLRGLQELLLLLRTLDEYREQPHDLGTFLLEKFLPVGKDRALLAAVLEGLRRRLPSCTFIQWGQAVQKRLTQLRLCDPSPKGRLLVTTNQLPGAFEHLFVLGLSDERFPRRRREDPLLPDTLRKILNKAHGARLALSTEDNARAGLLWQRTLGCAGQTVTVSWPSMDVADGRELNFSYLLLPLLETTGAANKSLAERLVPLRCPPSPRDPRLALHVHEWQLAHLEHEREAFAAHLLQVKPLGLPHLEARTSFWSKAYGPRTGLLGGNLLADFRTDAQGHHPFSASQLEALLACPYRWFVEKLLKVEPLEEPEALTRLDKMTLGSLVHRLLQEFLQPENRRRGELPAEAEAELHELAKRQVAALEEDLGGVLQPWRELLFQDLRGLIGSFLAHEQQARQDPQREVLALEYAFGRVGQYAIERPPLPIETAAGTILLNGAVDRIDRTSEGLLLLDYKTAKKYSYKRYEEGQVDNGREFRLQGLLYAAALNQAGLAGVKKTRGTVARSGYLPLRENAKPYLAAWDETAQQQLERHLAAALGLLRHGLVLQSGRCDYCRFGVMCGNGIVQAAQRRLESPQKPKVLEQVRSQYAALCTGGEEA